MLPTNLSNQDEGKALKARLYKKYESGNSQKNFLRASSPRGIPDAPQLIPKIALKKHLDTTQNMTICPAVTISKGKILLSPKGFTGLANLNQSAIAKDQTTLNLTASFLEPKNKTETEVAIKVVDEVKEKKKVEFSPLKHSVKAASSKSKAKKRKDYSYKKKRGQEKEQKNSSDYLTPIDFIHLIRTDPEMTDEFCYLNKRSHPYDFQIVDFNERNAEEYMTISARGITHFFDCEATFMTIEEWEREVKMFHRLRQIPFFSKYKIWKNFSLWKKHTRRNIMKDRSKLLSHHLFFLDKHLRRPLLEVRNICLHLSKLEYMDLSSSEPVKYDDFRTLQENYRVTLMDKKFDTLENAIKDLILNSCSTSLISFKEENRIPNKDPDNPSGDTEEPAPLLVGDETNKEMPYTQEATIRTHYKRLRKFIKLVDYLVLNGKLSMMNFSSELLLRSISEHNSSVKDPKRSSRINCWLICELGMRENELTFNPNKEITRKVFEEVISKGIQRICNKHRQLIHFPELLLYTQGSESEEDNNEELIDIQTLIDSDEGFKGVRSRMRREVEVSFENLVTFAQFLSPYLENFHRNAGIHINDYENKEIDELKGLMSEFKRQDQEFQGMEGKSEVGLWLVDNQALKDFVKGSAAGCLGELTKMMPEMVFKRSKALVEILTDLNNKLSWTPNESPMQFVEQFVTFSENVQQIAQKMEEYTSTNSELMALLYLILEEKIKIPEAYKSKVQEASSQITGLRKKIEEANAAYDQNLTKCKRKLEKLIPEMEERLKDLIARIGNSKIADKNADINKTVDFITEISNEIFELYDQSKKINLFQKSLQLEETNYEKIANFKLEFVMIEKLWKSRKEFRDKCVEWGKTHFLKVPIEKMTEIVEKLKKIGNECCKELETNEVARIFKQEIDDFQIIMESLISLRDPALGEKQWLEIKELFNSSYPNSFKEIDDVIHTVDYLNRIDFKYHHKMLQEIALKAAKEADLIKMLEGVEMTWKSLFIGVQVYKDSKDVYILSANEELISKVDDTLLVLNNLLGSRFVEGIRPRVELQLRLFRYLQELIDEWALHQKTWIYLEPIFMSQNTHAGLMKEVKAFNTADANWRKLMKRARENNLAKYWADDYVVRSNLKLLRKNNEVFDNIQKALDDYLEKKREQFQRFFFLSSDELLEILSSTKTPQHVQPHLRKVFENIVRLEFEKEMAISMVSAEGESVALKNGNLKGEVEEVFRFIEDQMRISLRFVMRQALLAYEKEDVQRKDWVFDYPLQVVTTVDSIYWTRLTEDEYLSVDSENDIEDWFQINVAQLDELIQLIRLPLAAPKRRTLVALVTQDVHYRDIIEQLCVDRIETVSDFKWQQQLRFYWTEDHLTAKQMNSSLFYGYEYLGATTRLVITPLTDRCWMTITGALQIKLGAQPSGPAGTGKTESCKDLAKALGKYCLVFNCSEQVNVKIMEKLFTGLCYTGSWACLDEFNRIDIEVLSVIAQQLLTIREGLLEGKTNFAFFSKNSIVLNSNLGVFVTMNPGYAGRTELPDNLKVLFRPVAMMVPNYELIAEIMLFAEGFGEARELSRKMTKLYKLSSEQLSQQDHYDFGMRAVKSVLVMAGNLKRKEPNESEEKILIRAMRDANLPKFLSFDIPLFTAILTDLFPGCEIPELENVTLRSQLSEILTAEGMTPSKPFLDKILQLHETLNVRFGVMMVGPTMGGKSTMIRVLKDAYGREKEEEKVESVVLNPKSISMNELYGEFDALTQTWNDGLAAKVMREFVAKESGERKWVVFDGPVDSLWIENMNTVLDDSMTLCLSNGERIKLRSEMKMLFEVLDLSAASPATVSRCGMVFIDSDVLETSKVVQSYFERKLFGEFGKDLGNYLLSGVNLALRKGIPLLRRKGVQAIPTVDNNLAVSVCRNVSMLLKDENDRKFLKDLEGNYKKLADKIIILAFSWGVAGGLANQEIYEKISTELFNPGDLPKGSIFSYYLSFTKPEGEYLPYSSSLSPFSYSPSLPYFSLLIPTPETSCFSSLLSSYLSLLLPVLLTGVTGTGKTLIVTSTLDRLTQEGVIAPLKIVFSSQTSSQAAQNLIEGRLTVQRKQKRVILMPPPGRKLVVFVDDVNMPEKEVFGAQPPIELLRQILDYGGVFDRKSNAWKEIDNTVLIGAAAPPGGGRSHLTPRFTRHFNILCLPPTSSSSLSLIFSSILSGFLKSFSFPPAIIDLEPAVVSATLALYSEMSKELLPTPNRPHYTFNLRDVSKVFQGLLMIRPTFSFTPEDLLKLWAHECSRVFQDRLVNESDRSWFREQMIKLVFLFFKADWGRDDLDLAFCDFLGREPEKRNYEQVTDMKKLAKKVETVMGNETNLKLVMFKDALQHITRLTRVLRQERGHLLLVGVGGSGKKSLSTVGACLAGSFLMTVEPKKNYGKNQFREDLFRIMSEAAFKGKSVTFVFSDSNILQEGFLEDINNLLNSGEVPALIGKDEMENINSTLALEAREKGYQDPYGLFLDRVREFLHVVLCFSPMGKDFRNRVRKFPSLVNCCTIDWLNPWPEEALLTVANMFLENLGFDGADKEIVNKLSELCVYVHQDVNRQADEFYSLLRRRVYTTPKSYIDLIEGYKELLKLKNNEITTAKNKLSNGLYKLEEANSTIATLKETLIKLQPELKQKTIEQEELIKKLEVDRYEANKKKTIVEEEERIVNEKAEKIREMKMEADKILNDALPILNEATEALNTLNRNDISEIKAQPNPHALVRFTLECVAVLLDEKSDWDNLKKLLADPGFLSRMKGLKVEGITKATQDRIKKKIASNPSFLPAEVQKINLAAKSICEWVRAVSEFTDVFKETEKKRLFVEDMNKELDAANQILSKKQFELSTIIGKVNLLEKQYNDNKKEKDRLDEEIKRTEARLSRAEELTKGLEDEQVRWKENVKGFVEDLGLLVGNVFLAGASVAYYGAFTGQFREKMVAGWLQKCIELDIPCSENYSLQKILGDPVELRDWNSKGLPSDSVSLNNGILVKYARSYPLMIDPQVQANRWIKNLLQKSNLKIIKNKTDNLIKFVENCIRIGEPVLIEDVEETLDPLLEPLLLKQYTYVNNRKMISIGDSGLLEVYDSFRIYFSSKLSNPNYLPEIFIRVNVINFTVTEDGLEEQLLGHVVRREMPEIELVRNELIVSIASDRSNLKRNEARILDLLNDSKGLILDDVDLIKSLQESKATSEVVKQKLEEAEIKQKQVEIARGRYLPVARRASAIYFSVADLAGIDPMYQFSLAYFTKVFNGAVERTKGEDGRVKLLIENVTESLFVNICRGLFNDHKRIFAMMLATKIEIKDGIINPLEFQVLLKGPPPTFSKPSSSIQKPSFLSDSSFSSLLTLRSISKTYDYILDDMSKNEENWKKWISESEPQSNPLPYPSISSLPPLTGFQTFLLLSMLRREKVVYGVIKYVESTLGSKFVENNPVSMEEVYCDTDSNTPLIFILSSGADPLNSLLTLAREKKITSDKLFIISLGQGQGPLAEKAIEKAMAVGGWTILQNCHLGRSFMPELEKKLESMESPEFLATVNQEYFGKFRLFLTSMPCNYFPVSILQNGMKLTNEPPKGIKANMMKSLQDISSERFEGALTVGGPQGVIWRRLIFSLSIFHAVIQERRKFGPLGWNILYEFNESDLETSISMMKITLESQHDLPWEALQYMTGEINYGGRVTDEWDRRLLLATLNRFLNDEVLIEQHIFFEGCKLLGSPPSYQEALDVVRNLAEVERPEVFGMHENANISFQLKESNLVLETILSIQPKDGGLAGGGEAGGEKEVDELCKGLEERLPLLLAVAGKKESGGKGGLVDSLDVCLVQECERFNKLISKMRSTIGELRRAMRGEEVMSEELDKMMQKLGINQVPGTWNKVAYPSMKPLGAWFDDLLQRVMFFRTWLESEKPISYWLPAFFFPQGFLTSVLQNHARRNKVGVDLLSFAFKFLHFAEVEKIDKPAAEGVYVHGLLMEGCKFDFNKLLLEDSEPGVMVSSGPIVNLVPVEGYEREEKDYLMPVYKTSVRAGVLSTTGHSTNFVVGIDCPTKKKPEVWIMNGAAFVCS